MASIRYRRNRQNWVVDWYEAGVRKTQAFSSRQVAQEFRRMKEEALERQRAGLTQTLQPISFAEYAELFMANHFREKSDRYYRSSYYLITRSFVPFLGEKLVHE